MLLLFVVLISIVLSEKVPLKAVNNDDGTIVNTTCGLVQGKIIYDNITGVPLARHWLGIPFATPPIGNLRFKSPLPPIPWDSNTIIQTINFGPTCPQPNNITPNEINEDCLYLNVFTPLNITTNLPVMIFIYGGGWEIGSSQSPIYRGGMIEYFNGKVVMVTINYRLGAFGFLASQGLVNESSDGGAGNYAMQDQRLAFQWVQNNIKNFGGDPTDVTIFGQSAGSDSVAFHLLANKSWGLFHRAIMHSGSYCNWSSNSFEAAEAHYNRIVKAVNCSSSTQTEEIACLRNKTVDEIVNNYQDNGDGWAPTVDQIELTDSAQHLASQGHFVRVPVMLGTVKDEGTILTGAPHNMTVTEYQQQLIYDYGTDLGPKVYQMYPPENYESPWWAYISQYTDWDQACPARRTARWLTNPPPSSGKPTTAYLWQFTHQLEASKFDPYLGVFHGTDLGFVFEDFEILTPPERELSKKMVQYWTQFAYFGDPNKNIVTPPDYNLITWPLYQESTDINVVLDLNFSTNVGLKKSYCDFWDTVPL